MISIVLPVYNGEDNLEASIRSVLKQSYHDFELIIVNDCSTDGTADVISRMMAEDSRIRCISNETNQKLPASLNIGFREARGDYFTWTSDDNRYHEDALKIMVEALEKNPKVGMVYCRYTAIDENENELPEVYQGTPEELIWGNHVGACFLYRSTVAKQVGEYDTGLFLAEDYDYWLRIYSVSEIIYIPQKLYYYKIHSRSLTSTRVEEIKHQTIVLWLKHWDFIFSRLNGWKEKGRYCEKMLERESDVYKKDTYNKIIEKYPMYRYYRIAKIIKNLIKKS